MAARSTCWSWDEPVGDHRRSARCRTGRLRRGGHVRGRWRRPGGARDRGHAEHHDPDGAVRGPATPAVHRSRADRRRALAARLVRVRAHARGRAMSTRHVATTVLLIAGCSLQVLAVIGLLAMRDTYDRLHYVGLAGYGALLIAAAILVRESFS